MMHLWKIPSFFCDGTMALRPKYLVESKVRHLTNLVKNKPRVLIDLVESKLRSQRSGKNCGTRCHLGGLSL